MQKKSSIIKSLRPQGKAGSEGKKRTKMTKRKGGEKVSHLNATAGLSKLVITD